MNKQTLFPKSILSPTLRLSALLIAVASAALLCACGEDLPLEEQLETLGELAGFSSQNEVQEEAADKDAPFPEHDCYYYSVLSEEEQLIYRELYLIMRDSLSDVTIDTLDTDSLGRLQEYVLLDNPELFYTGLCEYTTISKNDGSLVRVDFSCPSALTQEERETAEAALADYTSAFLTTVDASGDAWDLALEAYDYVISHADYQEDAPYNQNIYSAVLGETVCQGYAMSFEYLCQQLDIPCLVVTGLAADGQAHAWNMFYADDIWCHVDCTYGDVSYFGLPADYSWFGLPASFMEETRTMTYKELLPEGSSCQNTYYYRQGSYLESYSLKALKAITEKSDPAVFQFSSQEAYEEACRRLFEEEELQELGKSKYFYYITCDSSRTIYLRNTDEEL